tara:strand:- start:457 stop:777 length:321 start_codon:yes stop_codon:yes gene_type:complete
MAKYYVYVIELEPEVANLRKFRAKNPNYVKGNGCFYVGQSTRTPELRFDQHKEGYKSNKYAKYYGKKLRPDIYKKYNPIPSRDDSLGIEAYLGNKLRGKGAAVWFN